MPVQSPQPTRVDLEQQLSRYQALGVSPADRVNLGHVLTGLSPELAASEPAKKLALLIAAPSNVTATAASETLEVITIPIRFTRIDVGASSTQDVFDESKAREQVENLNEIWAQAGVQFSFAGLNVKQVVEKTALWPDPDTIGAATTALQKQAGNTRGIGSGYISQVARSHAIGEQLARTVLHQSLNGLGKDCIEVVVLGENGVLPPEAGTSFVVTDVTDHGVRTLAEYGREQFDVKTTRLVVYSYGTDELAPHRAGGGEPTDIGRYGSVLGHEVGHMLKLNHQGEDNLMDGSAKFNRMLPEQIAVARAAAQEILGLSPAGRIQREKVLAAITTVDSTQRLTGSVSPDAERLMRIYDGFPPVMQKLMASVERIEISTGMRSAAEMLPTSGGGFSLRFNRALMDADLDATEFLSWREQLNFSDADLMPKSGPEQLHSRFPQVTLQPGQGSTDYLEYLLIHELGHVLFHRHQLGTQWRALSSGGPAAASSDFKNREALRYYDTARQPLPESERVATYEAFAHSSFGTPYASQDEDEDFADAVLLRALALWRGGKMTLTTAPDKVIDLRARFDGPDFAAKRELVDAAFARELAR